MRTRGISTLLVTSVAGVALAGCGTAQTISQAVDPVARAADITAQAPGFRLAGSMQFAVAGRSAGATMTGVFVRHPKAGAITAHITLAGRSVQMQERLAGSSIYIHVPGASAVSAGKPWVKISIAGMAGGPGLTGVQGGSADPSQFVDYLRATGSHITRVGTSTIRGVAATHYRAAINLDRYPKLASPAEQSTARHTIAVLEAALGSHRLPVDVWLDHQGRVRQMRMMLAACLAGHRMSMAMTMDIYDYGPQTIPAAPAPSQVHDITALAKQRAAQSQGAQGQLPPACPAA